MEDSAGQGRSIPREVARDAAALSCRMIARDGPEPPHRRIARNDFVKSPRTFFQKSLTVIAERGNDSQRSSCDAKYQAGADEPHGDERDVPLCAILRKGGSR